MSEKCANGGSEAYSQTFAASPNDDCATLLVTRSAHASDKNQSLRLFVMATQTAAPSGLVSRGPRSLTEDRLQIGKDLGKIQVGLCARTEVAAGMGIHRDDRLYPNLADGLVTVDIERDRRTNEAVCPAEPVSAFAC